jgi:nitrogen fixation/metabolism regulation signal transduction histidine kinase
MNSNISLELYRLNDNIRYTVLVYLSYTGLFFCLLLHIQALRPVVKRFFGISYNILSRWGILLFALICAFYFTCTSSTLGFRKEVDRVTVWANRLAVDRNLALEIQLRSVEESIANDQLLSALSMLENTAGMLQNRISDNYLSRIRQDNSITVHVYKEDDKTGTENFNTITRSGTPISEGSRFFFLTDGNGRSTYAGTFFFWNKEHGLVRMLLMVEPNSNREDRGYYSILGRFSKPGEINIPSFYSYAKYIDDRLVSYKGNFPYPTVSFVSGNSRLASEDSHVLRMKDNVHFVNMVSENEVIVISRKQRSATAYFTSFSYLFLMIYAILFLFVRQENKKQIFKKNFFRKRINTILFTSSLLILASMAVISVLFVYKRNEANMYDLMSTKINTIQALMETRVRQASSWQDLLHPDIISSLENIGNTTKSDITLYTPEGKVFHSTNPEVFEKQILGSRINEDAYKNIRYMHQRFFIHREKITDYRYWMLYAPVFNDNRQMIGIISTPYTDRNYDFRREAFSHAALLINLFLLLLIASLLLSTRELNRIFSPLVEMGKKMDKTDIHNPEYIIYKREDEISTIVDAYNRMQEDLAASTKMLASAERDKAWSEMARQVAHEIKNPLTPIKLEIQRLIRLKQKGNPAWEEKFDKVADVVLEHIDILTDTANEFSTFAKLYSEEPVLINLDKILKEQLLIFDNKENVKISYIGLEDAYVMAPKPQLIRVFVNLITNAIQAVEIHQKELMENEGEFISGKIFIGLRNSTKDGYYDIVFDDNGAGVKEENLDKLFTPNFTTKTGGTGLGLAISRNIITKCEGEISYRKSYALGGASFTVTLPKHQG